MLYHILYEFLYPLNHYWAPLRVLNVFQYITFRTAYASLTALLISLMLGPWLITRLRDFQIGQQIREEGPKSHQKKAGTPTMGGVLIVVSIILPTLLWANLRTRYIWLAVLATFGFGAVGFADDYIKIVRRRSLGLTAREKMGFQTLIAISIGIYLLNLTNLRLYDTRLTVPFFKAFVPDVLIDRLFTTPFWFIGYLPFLFVIWIVIVGCSNTVNLTDGLDGLAIGCTITSAFAYALLCYAGGNFRIAEYLQVPFYPYTGELTVVCAALVGAGLGFLWFNCHPAKVIMGDTGALAIGGVIGVIAICCKQELLLAVVGGVFVIEAASVILQVLSFRLTGKRIFAMSPIHHHFELSGWKENTVIVRFWILSAIFALLGLATLKLR